MALERCKIVEMDDEGEVVATHECDIENALRIGVIVRVDTRFGPPRVFRYRSSQRIETIPVFEEVRSTWLVKLPFES